MQSIPLEFCENIPLSVINYVNRKGSEVVLANAYIDDQFSSDPYIESNRIKSILCTPVFLRRDVVGVLYLENNLSENVFTPNRVEVLKMLTAQAAISLENANLFSEIHSQHDQLKISDQMKSLFIKLNFKDDEVDKINDMTSYVKRSQEKDEKKEKPIISVAVDKSGVETKLNGNLNVILFSFPNNLIRVQRDFLINPKNVRKIGLDKALKQKKNHSIFVLMPDGKKRTTKILVSKKYLNTLSQNLPQKLNQQLTKLLL